RAHQRAGDPGRRARRPGLPARQRRLRGAAQVPHRGRPGGGPGHDRAQRVRRGERAHRAGGGGRAVVSPVRIAAVGDVHLGTDARGWYRPSLDGIEERADVLLLAGDLTRHGTLEEGRVVVDEFRDLPVPVVAVLGNHDYHSDVQREIASMLRDAGITVLMNDSVVIKCNGTRLGIVGGKGFGGGFAGKCASEFGEREIKDFVGHTKRIAAEWREALKNVVADRRVVLSHYSP